jgi:hypothetical protein
MKKLFIPLLAAGLLSGCGDPAPSTPLAPDIPPPDTSKISQADIDNFHQKEHDQGSVHTPGNPPR